MTESVTRLETSVDDQSLGPDITIRWLDDSSQSTIALSQGSGFGPMGIHTQAAEDLLAIAVAVYCADRSIVRENQVDGWTRHIRIDVPVRDPYRWDQDLLQRTLSFLTGDHWNIKLRSGEPHPGLKTTEPVLIPSNSVALFSGGMDSLAWACEALQSGESVALSSYFGDGPSGKLQTQMVGGLVSKPPHYQFRLLSISANRAVGWPGFIDSTMRSRSFLFLALGLLVARSQGAGRLWMPENGYIAINVPLHDGRIGSLSTRTAHPQFVDSLNRVLATADLGAQIENPYLFLTKGEVAERLIEHAPHLAWKSISCAHPTAARWQHKGFGNCGYCYPCLIRQAGFHHTGSDQTTYSANPFSDINFYNRSEPSSDARSVARFLIDPLQVGDILATGRIGSFDIAEKLHQMYERGKRELGNLFEQRATQQVKIELGL